MSRNRAKNTHSLHWAAVLKWVGVLMTFSILGAGYVAKKNQVLRLASEVQTQEDELNAWKKRNLQLKCNIAQLSSFGELQARLNSLGSGMVQISELQIIPMEGNRAGMEKTAIARNTSGAAGVTP